MEKYSNLLGKRLEDAIEILSNDGISYIIQEYNGEKNLQARTVKRIIRVLSVDGKLILTVSKFRDDITSKELL